MTVADPLSIAAFLRFLLAVYYTSILHRTLLSFAEYTPSNYPNNLCTLKVTQQWTVYSHHNQHITI